MSFKRLAYLYLVCLVASSTAASIMFINSLRLLVSPMLMLFRTLSGLAQQRFRQIHQLYQGLCLSLSNWVVCYFFTHLTLGSRLFPLLLEAYCQLCIRWIGPTHFFLKSCLPRKRRMLIRYLVSLSMSNPALMSTAVIWPLMCSIVKPICVLHCQSYLVFPMMGAQYSQHLSVLEFRLSVFQWRSQFIDGWWHVHTRICCSNVLEINMQSIGMFSVQWASAPYDTLRWCYWQISRIISKYHPHIIFEGPSPPTQKSTLTSRCPYEIEDQSIWGTIIRTHSVYSWWVDQS